MVISSLITFHQVDGTKWSDSWWVFTSHQLLKTTQAEALPVVSDFSLVGVGLGCSVRSFDLLCFKIWIAHPQPHQKFMIFGLAVTLLRCHSITNFPLVQAS